MVSIIFTYFTGHYFSQILILVQEHPLSDLIRLLLHLYEHAYCALVTITLL